MDAELVSLVDGLTGMASLAVEQSGKVERFQQELESLKAKLAQMEKSQIEDIAELEEQLKVVEGNLEVARDLEQKWRDRIINLVLILTEGSGGLVTDSVSEEGTNGADYQG